MTPSQKKAKIRALRTEVLDRILDNLGSPENMPRDEQHPLGGLVHLSGIGQVTVTALRAERDRRRGGTTIEAGDFVELLDDPVQAVLGGPAGEVKMVTDESVLVDWGMGDSPSRHQLSDVRKLPPKRFCSSCGVEHWGEVHP